MLGAKKLRQDRSRENRSSYVNGVPIIVGSAYGHQEETKDALRNRKKRKPEPIKPTETSKVRDGSSKKRVSFA